MTFDELIKLHSELWTETNLAQQEAKFNEEFDEFQSAEKTEDKYKELADMVIVSAGIARFNYTVGLTYLTTSISIWSFSKQPLKDLWDFVERKMEVNKNRKWNKDPNVGYHHED